MEKTDLSLLSIVLEISQAVDMVNPRLSDHHTRVAYIIYRLAQALGLGTAEQKALTVAGAIHDIGVLSFKESSDLLHFEIEDRPDHGEVGYLFVRSFAPLAGPGELIRSHHVYWQDGAGEVQHGQHVPPGSHLLHLADRIAILINSQQEILTQTNAIRKRISEQSGRMFVPRFVEAFLDLSAKEYFWLDAASPALDWQLAHDLEWETLALDGHQFMELARLFCHIVDFKSPFTAAHSSGVAACAGTLGRLSGFSDAESTQLITAGYLHDIGKLGVPLEILEKPAALDEREMAIMRHHSYQTYQVLRRIGMDERVRSWSTYHHERLDGSGYPFHLAAPQLSAGSRIMTVADIFTALVENRPYRPGLPRQQVIPILQGMVAKGWLDGDLMGVLSNNFDEMNTLCQQAEEQALQDYHAFAHARSSYEQIAAVDAEKR